MDLDQLRRETRPQHESAEKTVPLMHDSLTLEQYRNVLLRFYGIIRAWDSWSAAHAPENLRPLLADRHRSPLLAADLAFLQTELPVAGWGPTFHLATDEAAFLGTMYVIEGSTLGGQYIARHVEECLGLEPGHGDAYFRGYGEQTGAKWTAFKAVLAAIPQEQAGTVIGAAKSMFHIFEQWMQPLVAEVP